ncbi:sentrin-specific protease 8-like isoform X2 [Coccinella septempunctata]|uniref:sentrin-specific protease 8-like isoform X2 n=1 Tax=Coccinella septempunctata TaxID=41139 RepID=UPI001D077CE7|nr:sentrin-specific protease 8-like isoform X2 [Coccinella septempunctata]
MFTLLSFLDSGVVGIFLNITASVPRHDRVYYLGRQPYLQLITALIQITPANEIGAFLEPLEVDQKDLIIFALHGVADSEDMDHSHWSLLVYSKWDNKIFHFDSQNGYNNSAVRSLSEKLQVYFNINVEVKEVECLQQKKPQDCGIHVLANAEQIITYAAKARTVNDCPKVSEKAINEYRQKMLKLIWKLKHSSSIYQIKSKQQPSLFSKSWHDEHDRDRF